MRVRNLSDAYEMAVGLCARHGLDGWRVELDTVKRTAGPCRYAERVIGWRAPLTVLHDEAEVRDTGPGPYAGMVPTDRPRSRTAERRTTRRSARRSTSGAHSRASGTGTVPDPDDTPGGADVTFVVPPPGTE